MKDLYFVARGEGRHLFARTYEQHLANIRLVHAPAATGSGAGAKPESLTAAVDSTRHSTPRP